MASTDFDKAVRQQRQVPVYPMTALTGVVLLLAGFGLLIWGVLAHLNALLIGIALMLLGLSCLLDLARDMAINSWHQRRLLEQIQERERDD